MPACWGRRWTIRNDQRRTASSGRDRDTHADLYRSDLVYTAGSTKYHSCEWAADWSLSADREWGDFDGASHVRFERDVYRCSSGCYGDGHYWGLSDIGLADCVCDLYRYGRRGACVYTAAHRLRDAV